MKIELVIPPETFEFSIPSSSITFLLLSQVEVTHEMRLDNSILESIMDEDVISTEVNTAFDFLDLDRSAVQDFLLDHRKSFPLEPRNDRSLREYWTLYEDVHTRVVNKVFPDTYRDLRYGL